MSISTLIGASNAASSAAAASQAASSSAISAAGAGTAASSTASVETAAASSSVITLSASAGGNQVSLSAAGVALPAQGESPDFAQDILYGMACLQNFSNQYEGNIIAQQFGNFSPATMAITGQAEQEYSQSPNTVQTNPELTPVEQKALMDAMMPDVEMALSNVAEGALMPLGGMYCWMGPDRPAGVFGIDSITTSVTSDDSGTQQIGQTVAQDDQNTVTSTTGAQQISSANQANLTLNGMCYFYGQEMQFQIQAQINGSGQLTSSFNVTSTTPAPAADATSVPAAASAPADAAPGPVPNASAATSAADAAQPNTSSSATSAAASTTAPTVASSSALASQFSSLSLNADLEQSKTVIDLLSSVTGQLNVAIDGPTVTSASFVGILGSPQSQF